MDTITILIWVLAATIIDSLLGLVGIFSLWLSEKHLGKIVFVLVAFSAGAMLSGAFFHLLAESIEPLGISNAFVFVFAGFLVFFIMERFLHWHHCHEGVCETHPVTYLVLIGDGMHNFIDGLVIAASFFVSIPFGIITTGLIIAHEVPQELGNFGILVFGGFGKIKAILFSFASQLTCIVGGIIGALLVGQTGFSVALLPFAAGGFIYIAASDLVPELHKETDTKKVIISFTFFLAGVIFLYLIKILFE